MSESYPWSVPDCSKGEAFGMKATGKPITFEGIRKFRVRDGQVVEAWDRFDFFEDVSADGCGEDGAG